MSTEEIDGLFGHTYAGRSWYEQLEPEPRLLIDTLVERVEANGGTRPNSAAVKRLMKDRFGVTVSPDTIRKTIDRLLEARQ